MGKSDRDNAARTGLDQAERREVWAAPHLSRIDASETEAAADGITSDASDAWS
jgi:hypothetical protein